MKWDGYRLCVVIDPGKATVRTRRGAVAPLQVRRSRRGGAAVCQNAVTDGEAIVLDDQGHANFAKIDVAGAATCKIACERGLEGMVSKRVDSPY